MGKVKSQLKKELKKHISEKLYNSMKELEPIAGKDTLRKQIKKATKTLTPKVANGKIAMIKEMIYTEKQAVLET